MAQGLERLNVVLSLVDQVSRPLRAVQRSLSTLNVQVERSTRHVTTGFLAGSGAVLGLVGALKPAIAHSRALAEVASLGVGTENLELLSRAGMDYAARFGESATDFVRSAYDIQSAIGGLSGDELASFTAAANITAKATKAGAEEVTGFFGTMFGIFQRQADAMGRAEWVEMLSGQTAKAVQMFKTTGPQMSAAFANLGASAATMGLSMAEQFAVLGRLQSTMSGSEAATKFRAFLAGVGKAQQSLGLSFTDSQGKLLAMPEILERIRGKFGAIDTVAKSDLLKKAFGSDEAVALVKLLLADTEALRGNIASIQFAGGLQGAAKMAETMVDPFERLQRVVENVAITWGSFLLPLITPYVEKLNAAGQAVRAWAERFPHLTRLVGLGAVAVFGFTLAVAALKVVVGLLGFALLPLRAGLMLLRSAVPVAVWAASTAAMLAWRGALLALQGVLLLAKVAVWAFNVALWLNPITWVVVAVVALIAAIALSIVYWDELKAAVLRVAEWFDTMPAWAQVLVTALAPFIAIPLKVIANWERTKTWLTGFWKWLTAGFGAVVDQVSSFFAGLLGPDTLLGKLAGLVGLGPENAAAAPAGTLARRGTDGAVVPGAARAISNVANSTDNSRRLAIGTVNVTSSKRLDGHELMRQLALAADG